MAESPGKPAQRLAVTGEPGDRGLIAEADGAVQLVTDAEYVLGRLEGGGPQRDRVLNAPNARTDRPQRVLGQFRQALGPDRHIGQDELDRLEIGQGLAELLAVPDVVGRRSLSGSSIPRSVHACRVSSRAHHRSPGSSRRARPGTRTGPASPQRPPSCTTGAAARRLLDEPVQVQIGVGEPRPPARPRRSLRADRTLGVPRQGARLAGRATRTAAGGAAAGGRLELRVTPANIQPPVPDAPRTARDLLRPVRTARSAPPFGEARSPGRLEDPVGDAAELDGLVRHHGLHLHAPSIERASSTRCISMLPDATVDAWA